VNNLSTRRGRILRSALLSLPGLVLIALATFICFGLHLQFKTVNMVYVVIIVLQSLIGNFVSSAIVSGIAFLALNYFFVSPIFTLRVNDASDTLALFSFLVASLVITRLTSQAHEAADSEERQRRQMTHLYGLARQLLTLEPAARFEAGFLEPFRSEFRLNAVCLFDAELAKLHTCGESGHHLYEAARDAYICARDFDDPACQVAVRLLRIGGKTVGAVGFEALRDQQLTAGPLAALMTIMIERCHSFDQASRASAATEAEVFRGAVLDALAHEFKTPLATILTAASGLRGIGPLRPDQRELAEAVESEATHLGQLTSRLLRVARLEREEVKPQMEIIDVAEIVRALVAQHAKRWRDRHFTISKCDRVEVSGDRELLWLGFGQLIDNACKYSQPGAEVEVSIETGDDAVIVRVRNSGSSIPPPDWERVFERFYRAADVKTRTPGSGLGLYVARKIAVVHGGNVVLDHAAQDEGTTFRFSIARTKETTKDDDVQIQCASRG
jgi:two-component system, OmpR family, sensor histidine kinase KdpD